ncbi:MAG: hypothetical protein KF847_19640 [Pirellulales bacterium]|nr:hypothetical protein [Pirellulales bacterium]
MPAEARGAKSRPAAAPTNAAPARPAIKRQGKRDPNEAATTLRELAAAMGRGYKSVHEWTHRPDWPWPRPPQCWPLRVAEVEAWAARTLVRDAASGGRPTAHVEDLDPLKRLRVLKLEQEVAKLRALNDQLRSRLIDRADAQAELAAYIAAWRTAVVAEARSIIDAIDSAGGIAPGWHDRAQHMATDRAEAMCHRFADEMIQSVRRAR